MHLVISKSRTNSMKKIEIHKTQASSYQRLWNHLVKGGKKKINGVWLNHVLCQQDENMFPK
jgi:hypothetical protein